MSMYTDTNRILKMRGTGCRVPSMDNPYVNGFSRPLPFYSGTHLVVLLTWFFVVSPALSDIFHGFKKCIRVKNTLFNFATSQKRDFYENEHFHSLFNL